MDPWPITRSILALTRGWPRLLAGLVALVLLAGCNRAGQHEKFDNYLERLAHTLTVAPGPVSPDPAPVRPRTGMLRLDIATASLDTLDFLALSGCAVQVTMGKRNSSLGRMARDSQRLLLELEYLRLAPQCIAFQRERGENALASTLQQAWELKRQQLPALIFNATLGSTEYRQFWQLPANPGDYPADTSSVVISAAQGINSQARRWLAGDYEADNRAFEILLGEVATGDGGALLQALASQGAWLSAANVVLEQRMAEGPLCAPGLRPAASDILENVVRKYFVGEIQPWSAALGRRYHELLPPIEALEELLDDVLPPAYRDWRVQRDTQLARLAQAPRRHVEHLVVIQRPCGSLKVRPGKVASADG